MTESNETEGSGPLEYEPIACALYDRLEEAATLKKRVEIRYRDGKGQPMEIRGRIIDLRVSQGAEWLVLEEGLTLRLDQLLYLDGVPFRGAC